MRQFARLAGISNPYLSQIERGLREPSERVVEAIARSLKTSAEALYEEAGCRRRRRARDAVPAAIAADAALTPRQRKVMLDVYDAFVASGPPPRPARASRRARRRRAGEGVVDLEQRPALAGREPPVLADRGPDAARIVLRRASDIPACS